VNVSARLDGVAGLQKRLEALPSALSAQVQRAALVKGAELIRAEAARLAPRSASPGEHMADAIIIDALTPTEIARGSDWTTEEAVVEVGPSQKHFYGYFIEYGTVKMRARPFMRPATDSKAGVALNVALSHLWASIKAVGSGGTLSLPSNVGTVGSRNL